MNDVIEHWINQEWLRQTVVGMAIPIFLYLVGRTITSVVRWLTTTPPPPPPEIQRLLDKLTVEGENSLSAWRLKAWDCIEHTTTDGRVDLRVNCQGQVALGNNWLDDASLLGHAGAVYLAANKLFHQVEATDRRKRRQDIANQLKSL